MKDFTKAQGVRWVVQEAAKSQTLAAAEKRIAQEVEMLKLIDEPGMPDLPNSRQAHADLIDALRAQFGLIAPAK